MISIKNVSKSYDKKNNIIKNLSLDIKNGEIFGFLGSNGAGKTTTIKMITGILDIDEGDILINNKSIKLNSIEAKKSFGYVPDNPDIFLNLKGIEYLNFIADMYEVNQQQRKQKIEELGKLFEIYEVLNEKIKNYSHGMRQKIIIIGSLLHEPENWIIDEPFTGLDPNSTYKLKQLMKKYISENKCVFFSTHILDVAEKLCDRIGIINKGELLFVGTIEEIKEELKENKSLEELFMEIMKNDKKDKRTIKNIY